MGLFFKRKKLQGEPPPPWVKWLFAAFVLIAVIGGLRKGTPEHPNQIHQAFQKAGDDLNPKKLFRFDDYVSKVFPNFSAELKTKDIAPGQGEFAVCGQQVKIAYEAFLIDGKPVGDTADKANPLAFRIGDGKALPAIEEGVIGMKPGGKRSIFSRATMAYGAKGFERADIPPNTPIRFEIELLEATPPLPAFENSPYRILTARPGAGFSALCGQPVKAQIVMWSVNGKKLFSTKDENKQPISFTPGKSEVFLGLEQGILGLEQGGARTLIVPPDFQKTMDGNKPAVDFPFPKDQTVLVDVELVN